MMIIKNILPFILSGLILLSSCSSAKVPTLRTFAQEDSSNSELQDLSNELNNRWFNTKLPTYLSERRAGEEVTYNGPMLDSVQDYKEILESDLNKNPGKISALIDTKVYSSLQHQMNSKNLPDFLKSGKIIPRNGKFGAEESMSAVYLELHRKNNPKDFLWGDVEVHFQYKILDRSDYYINTSWNYGVYGPLSASNEINPGRVAYYVTKFLLKGDQNEVVFVNPLSLSEVDQIFVRKGKKAALLKKIKANNIVCAPITGGCAALISEK